MAPFHSVFYAPQFVGIHRGFFAEEGLDVTTEAAGGGRTTVSALLDGSIDIGLGGIMRSLDLADREGRLLPHFVEVNSRNGFFLLAREPRPRFAWSDLEGREVISFAEAPTPWQCMLTVLRKNGVDPARVRFTRDLPTPQAVKEFRAGRGDFLEQGQTVTEQLLADGAAFLVASMGDATGPVPFSSFMTTPAFLARERSVLERFTRAMYRTQRWMARAPARDVAAAIAPAFPDVDPVIGEQAIDRYLRQATWARDPLVRRPGYEYLQRILLDGGFIQREHRYEDLVDTAIAEAAMKAVDGE
ncbi:MAG TPA: ABC transporter substrate-binding protein [Candidatus Acidoferrum sp.]|nr:ABC transporter substrate-binding protein [Candidatus Acidoferrum sp.]